MPIDNFSSDYPVPAAGGAVQLNPSTISANYTLPTGFNGVSTGPVVIADGVTVTIPSGTDWTIV